MPDERQQTSVRAFTEEELRRLEEGDRTVADTDPIRSPSGTVDSALRPRLWIINANVAMRRRIPPRKPVYSFGASREESDVQLFDGSIAQRQLVIMRLGDEWLLADAGAQDLVCFDGVSSRQVVCPWGSRTIATVGESTVIFIAHHDGEGHSLQQLGGKRLRRHDEALEPAKNAHIVVEGGRQPAKSTGECILIGSHTDCDVTLGGDQIATFHAIVFWGPEGIGVQALTDAPVTVDDNTGRGPFLLTARHNSVRFGDGPGLAVRLEGDCLGHCQATFPENPVNFEHFGLTNLEHPEETAFEISAYGSPLAIGRSRSCDLVLPDSAASRVHAQIIPSGKTFYLIDNYSSNGTFVNGARATKARCRAGDLVDIGNVTLAVHYA